MTISKVIPDRSDILYGKSDVFVVTTKDTESECCSATKLKIV